MKNITIATTFAAMMISGSAMADNSFPCSKAQFWITSMQTTPAGTEMHRDNHQINIAASVLQPRSTTYAQGSSTEIPNT